MKDQSDSGTGLRADAQLNRERVLDAARAAFAQSGFDASYHRIAQLAGVGVGTVYRRYPDRNVLLEAVLLHILSDLTLRAEAACAGEKPWEAFEKFFTELATDVRRHAGLSERLENRGGPDVAAARAALLRAVKHLHARVRGHGLREDLGWQDILFLAQIAGASGCGLMLDSEQGSSEKAVRVIVDGMRKAITR